MIGVIWNEDFLKHRPHYPHPENPSRLEAILKKLKSKGVLDKVKKFDFEFNEDFALDLAGKIHSKEHIEAVKNSKGSFGNFDADTYYSPDSYTVALKALQASAFAVEKVINEEAKFIFVLERPPGHHATFSEIMGFCIFNNIAGAAKRALELGKERILIVDFDVHHGNGTQQIFYSDDKVLFFSSHRYPFYPGTGHFSEKGEGKGKGFTVNLPLPSGMTDYDYKELYTQILLPVVEKFDPEIILVSAGFDAHWRDPLADMKLTEEFYSFFAQTLKQLSKPAVFILEGGYDLEGLSESVLAIFETLLDERNPNIVQGRAHPLLTEILEESKKYFAEWIS